LAPSFKLFFVSGIRHSAVVIAEDGAEAVKLAEEAHGAEDGKADQRVLYGSVGDWEVPQAIELVLPQGYQITRQL